MALSIFDDTRADWNARTPTGGGMTFVGAGAKHTLTWHWSGNATWIDFEDPHSRCLNLIRAWQNYHMDTHGWRDLGYHILICVHGRIIEGCKGLDTSAAHAYRENTGAYGVQFMRGEDPGKGRFEHLNSLMAAAAEKVENFLDNRAGRSLTEKPHGDMTYSSTSCAGSEINPWVRAGRPARDWEDDMPLIHDDKVWIRAAIRDEVRQALKLDDDLVPLSDARRIRLWGANEDGTPKGPEAISVSRAVAFLVGNVAAVAERQEEHREENREQSAGLEAVIKELSVRNGVTEEEVGRLVDAALADLRIDRVVGEAVVDEPADEADLPENSQGNPYPLPSALEVGA